MVEACGAFGLGDEPVGRSRRRWLGVHREHGSGG
jgi:hypothetical protein